MSIDRSGFYSHKVLKGIVNASGLVTIADRQPANRERIKYVAVVVENETSSDSNFRVGVKDANYFYIRKFFASVAADTPQTYDAQVDVARDNEQLEVRVAGGTEGDVISVTLHYNVEFDATDIK